MAQIGLIANLQPVFQIELRECDIALRSLDNGLGGDPLGCVYFRPPGRCARKKITGIMNRLPFELLFALRYLRPRRTFVSIITLISIIGVVLGVAV